MGRGALTGLALTAVLAAPVAPHAAGGRLVAIDRVAVNGSARVTYVSPTLTLPQPLGGGPGDLLINLHLKYQGVLTSYYAGFGAFDGTAGWRVNDPGRATYRNTSAPAGPTGIRKTAVRPGGRATLVAKSLGDNATPLAFSGPPTSRIDVSYDVTSMSSGVVHNCATFDPADCTYRSLAGGAGWKLVCGDGVTDPGCSAVSTTTTSTVFVTTTSTSIPPNCGNGVRDAGEQCDGGPACTPWCGQLIPDCCQGTGQCAAGLGFSLNYYLLQWCMAVLPGSTPVPGGICQPDGTCQVASIEPVPVCCEPADGSGNACSESTAGTTAGLWSFRNVCTGATLGTTYVNAVCGQDESCVPQ